MLEIGFLYYFGLLEEGFEFVSNNCVAIKMMDDETLEAIQIPTDIGITIEQMKIRNKKRRQYEMYKKYK